MPNAHRHTELEIIQALRKLNSASTKDIGAHLSLSHKWVEDKIRILRAARRIYISDWQKKSLRGDYRRLYSLRKSDEEDEPKPKALTGVQKSTEYRRRQKLKRILCITNTSNQNF